MARMLPVKLSEDLIEEAMEWRDAAIEHYEGEEMEMVLKSMSKGSFIGYLVSRGILYLAGEIATAKGKKKKAEST